MRKEIKQQRLVEKLNSELGSALLSYLSNPSISEIMLNPDGRIWIDTENGLIPTDDFIESITAMQLIGSVAEFSDTVVNDSKQILETELPFTSYRFTGIIPPLAKAPSFSIRKHNPAIFTLDDYLHQKVITNDQAKMIIKIILDGKTILIAGGPGTGKTTFANALLNEMVRIGSPNQRFILIEDTQELQCAAANTLALKTNENADHDQLLKTALRLRPDVICVGECRGKEMLTLLKAWNTGTRGGIATIHANTSQSAILRVVDLANESGCDVSPHLICESINVIITLTFDHLGRRIEDVKVLKGFHDGQYILENCY